MMADSLFDIAFDGYMKPLQADALKTATDFNKVQVQVAQLELDKQRAVQARMQQIWGPNATTTLQGAITNPTSQDIPKLLATAETYMATSNVAQGTQILNSLGLMQYRGVEEAKYRGQIQKENLTRMGAVLNGVTDQQSYQQAYNLLEQEGLRPEDYGLTTDYASSQARADAIVNQSKTAHQQELEQANADKAANADYWKGVQMGYMGQRIKIAQQQADLAQKRLDEQKVMDEFRKHERELADIRAQEGLDLRKLGKDARGYSNATKVQKPELEAAKSIFGLWDVTKDMPQQLRDTYATMAAMRAKQLVADRMRDSEDDAYEPEDYDSALNEVMLDFKKQGIFDAKQQGGGFFGGAEPAFKQPAPTNVIKPKATLKNTGRPEDPTSYKDPRSLQEAIKKGVVKDRAAVDAYAKKMGWQ